MRPIHSTGAMPPMIEYGKSPVFSLWKTLPGLIAILNLGSAQAQLVPDANTTIPGEFRLREHAIKSDLPVFPDDAIRDKKTGVAVAIVEVDTAGRVSEVTVLEAPAPSIEEALVRTLKLWRFKPFQLENGTPTRVRSKLTFYFVIQNNSRPAVYNSANAPYVGRWPENPK